MPFVYVNRVGAEKNKTDAIRKLVSVERFVPHSSDIAFRKAAFSVVPLPNLAGATIFFFFSFFFSKAPELALVLTNRH